MSLLSRLFQGSGSGKSDADQRMDAMRRKLERQKLDNDFKRQESTKAIKDKYMLLERLKRAFLTMDPKKTHERKMAGEELRSCIRSIAIEEEKHKMRTAMVNASEDRILFAEKRQLVHEAVANMKNNAYAEDDTNEELLDEIDALSSKYIESEKNSELASRTVAHAHEKINGMLNVSVGSDAIEARMDMLMAEHDLGVLLSSNRDVDRVAVPEMGGVAASHSMAREVPQMNTDVSHAAASAQSRPAASGAGTQLNFSDSDSILNMLRELENKTT